MKRRIVLSVFLLVVVSCGCASDAGIASEDGSVVFVSIPPANISDGNWESNSQIFAFNEMQSLILSIAVKVDISVPGTSQAGDENPSAAILAAGDEVNSYYIHFDPTGPARTSLTGSVTFTDPVLGLIALTPTLEASNSVLGLANETYDVGDKEGLEIYDNDSNGTGDSVTLSPDRLTVSFALNATSDADDLRIVTAVPEPGSVALLGIFSGALLARRKMNCDRGLRN